MTGYESHLAAAWERETDPEPVEPDYESEAERARDGRLEDAMHERAAESSASSPQGAAQSGGPVHAVSSNDAVVVRPD